MTHVKGSVHHGGCLDEMEAYSFVRTSIAIAATATYPGLLVEELRPHVRGCSQSSLGLVSSRVWR